MRSDGNAEGDFSLLPSTNRQAFVFYATSHEYAISVLVFVQLLQRLGIRSGTDLVVLHLPLAPWVLEKMRGMGMITVAVPALPLMKRRYYRHCLTKLRIFQLLQYDRVVYLDADAIPLKSLDDLLIFPFDGPIAAPPAYWLQQPYWTTALLVVRPSIANWSRVSSHFKEAAQTSVYDMEIINREFGAQIQTLPGGIFSLDSEWEHVNRVNFFGEPNEAYSRVSVVHFSSLRKPWSYSTNKVSRVRPNAHPIFYELWETWRSTREEICRGFVVKDYLARGHSALKRRIGHG